MTPRRSTLAVLLVAATAVAAGAEDNVESERMLVEVIQSKRAAAAEEAPSEAAAAPAEPELPVPEEPRPRSTGRWAVLPQVGYSPEKGPNAGIKFTDRDLFQLTVDLGASYALKKQRNLHGAVVAPELFGGWLIALASGDLGFDPTKEFFGLGNNDVGPDPLSTNEYQRVNGGVLLAAPLSRRFALAFGGAYNQVRIRRGDLEKGRPSTVEAFPELPGIRGGNTNPLSIALVFNSREELARPTRGWNVITKIQHVPHSLGNDFHYTRYSLDGSYLYPLLTRRQVLGLRVGGDYIDAKRGQVPFYELASLGGSRDLRGYFQDRFLGRSRLVLSGEYRLGLLDFDFFDIWRVKIDGVGFVDAGRVFIDRDELANEFHLGTDFFTNIVEDFRYSYGGGVRIALGQAILARIDVGFSREETALVYLTFGHTF